MSLCTWAKSNADYSRDLLQSGIEGARSGREAFLKGASLRPFLDESVRSALGPAVLGTCIGILGSLPRRRRRSMGRSLAFGLLGAALGLSAGILWESRRLTASVAGGALKNMGRVRDEHWLEKHPIDYA